MAAQADSRAAYRLLDTIGRGASATVHRARDPSGRTVALKLIEGPEAARPGLLDRLAAEVALSRRLALPGLVAHLDSGTYEGKPFLAMELVEGPTLQAMMAKHRQPVAQSLSIAAAVADTLAALHAAGAVHRDVKPGNIMMRAGMGPVVMDLGIAALGPAEQGAGGDLLGSPGFLAPELIDGHPFDGKADVFALGVVLYMLLTDKRPFDGSADTVMDRIRHAEPAPPSASDPTLPRVLDAVLARALAKDPRERYSASEFAAASRAL
jgi:serine/threonine-protein kinase